MKHLIRDVLISAAIGFLMPGVILNYGAKVREQTLLETVRQEPVSQSTQVLSGLPVKVRTEDGSVALQNMDDYLTGVLLAEMPAAFEPEALKAQSVVARTFARKAYTTKGKHGDGSVCTDPSCCQGFCPEDVYLQQGGDPEDVDNIRSAVLATSGQVLTYDGELIEATYFSCSGGSTEDAVAVWGTDFPYLQAVDSPGEERAVHYQDTVELSKTDLEDALGITLVGHPESWVQTVSYTRGGGVDAISIGGTFFTGTEIRQKLNLRSTAFITSADGENLSITTRGYGHRVGMSQYGADAMAQAGSTYDEILMYYYQGAALTQLDGT